MLPEVKMALHPRRTARSWTRPKTPEDTSNMVGHLEYPSRLLLVSNFHIIGILVHSALRRICLESYFECFEVDIFMALREFENNLELKSFCELLSFCVNGLDKIGL